MLPTRYVLEINPNGIKYTGLFATTSIQWSEFSKAEVIYSYPNSRKIFIYDSANNVKIKTLGIHSLNIYQLAEFLNQCHQQGNIKGDCYTFYKNFIKKCYGDDLAKLASSELLYKHADKKDKQTYWFTLDIVPRILYFLITKRSQFIVLNLFLINFIQSRMKYATFQPFRSIK